MAILGEGSALVAKLTESNGLARLRAGEAPDAVCNGYNVSEKTAATIDCVIGVNQTTGLVEHALRVDGVAEVTTTNTGKNRVRRVWFNLSPDERLEVLIGQPSPLAKSRIARGYVPTHTLLHGDATVQETDTARRAVVGDFTLTVNTDGNAHLTVPTGRTVTITT